MAMRVFWLTVLFLALIAPSLAEEVVPPVRDLREDAKLARMARVPILVIVSSYDCPYCHRVEQHFLIPMLRNRSYQSRVLFRRLDVHDAFIRDFEGNEVSGQDLATRYRAWLTPTVLFLGPTGRELAERVVGLTNEYYYGGLLDDGIDTALEKLRGS